MPSLDLASTNLVVKQLLQSLEMYGGIFVAETMEVTEI
jgi:hypothetical protein